MTWRPFLLLTIAGVWGGSCPVFAQREIVAPAPAEAAFPFALQVITPGAYCAAVSDALGLLVVGHKAMKNQQLSVFRLDTKGDIMATAPQRISLPCPDPLKKFPTHPLSVAFHPTLPLLYVWQDIQGPPAPAPEAATIAGEFDHLLIYAIKDGSFQLVQSCARGGEFAYRMSDGSILIEPGGEKIYLPNIRAPSSSAAAAVGAYALDAQGMPVKKPETTVPELDTFPPCMAFPCGLGFVPGSGEAVIYGAASGPATWDFNNRRAYTAWFLLPGISGSCMITGHPKLPLVFVSSIGTSSVWRMQHADGYLTLLPQRVAVTGATFQSAPVVMLRQNKLAVGAANALYLLKLDAESRLTPFAERHSFGNQPVRVLVWSEKYDRLYVILEVAR